MQLTSVSSVAISPVSLKRVQSLEQKTCCASLSVSGSCSLNQRIRTSVSPANNAVPLSSNALSVVRSCCHRLTRDAALWSVHAMPLRSSRPPESSSQAPIMWPVHPIAITSCPETPASSIARRMASFSASQDASGSSSTHPGLGATVCMGSWLPPSCLPSGSKITTFVTDVPLSIPIKHRLSNCPPCHSDRLSLPYPCSCRTRSSSMVC